ncbi:MAG: lysylphosphatidylglycerol synthase transmembrane domain-containing protein [Gemmatimonadota bacterium]
MRRYRHVALMTGFIVAVALIAFAIRRMDLARLGAELRAVQPAWLFAALLAYVMILPLWAAQWRVLAPPVAGNRYWNMLGVIALTSTLMNTTAMFLGEAGAVLLLVTRIGVSRSAALSVLAMDQLLVGVAKLAVIGTASAMIAIPSPLHRGSLGLAVGVASLLAACIAISSGQQWLTERLASVIPARGVQALRAFSTTLAPLRSLKRASMSLSLALAKKVVEVLAILCVQRALGVTPSAATAVLVLAATSLSTLLPLVPGNIGTYEGAIVFVYLWVGIPLEKAVGMAVVQHACYFTALALPGIAWLGRPALANDSAVAS